MMIHIPDGNTGVVNMPQLLTILKLDSMYFYIHKINNNEDEQAQLLEMCRNAGLHVRNGESIYGISTQTYSIIEKLRGSTCNFFIYRPCII